MSGFLTRVLLHYGRDRFNYYIRFGTQTYRDNFEARRAYEYYQEGKLFGYVRWEANQYGTQNWRFLILQAGDSQHPVHLIPGITPGAEILSDVSGKDRVLRLFQVIDAMEMQEINPENVAPWFYVQTNARLNHGLPARKYTREQHEAWVLEKRVRGL